jgi:hypothetical protein
MSVNCTIDILKSWPGPISKQTINITTGCATSGVCSGGFYCNASCQKETRLENNYTLCTDTIDNDCDYSNDTADISCYGNIYGSVLDSDHLGYVVPGAYLKASPVVIGAAEVSNISNLDGYYWLNKVFVGTHGVLARKDGYVDDTREVTIIGGQNVAQDFLLGRGTNCDANCTDSNGLCNWACRGWVQNGSLTNDSCQSFPAACSGKPVGYRIFDVSGGVMYDYTCCEGPNITYPASKADITANVDNLIDYEMPVKINRRLYMMHILVWANNTR